MNVKVFEKEGVGSVRAVMRDGEPFVCARDVARACGYGSMTSAVRDRCAEPPTYMPIGLGCGNNSARVIGEADVFRLCSGGVSHAESRFRAGEWLFGDVFPTMRESADEPEHGPEEQAREPDAADFPGTALGAPSAAALLRKMRRVAVENGNHVRANALDDALAVLQQVVG